MKLWIVGHILSEDASKWVFVGVFDGEEKAIKACRDDNYFIGPATLNEQLPPEIESWPNAYYPSERIRSESEEDK